MDGGQAADLAAAIAHVWQRLPDGARKALGNVWRSRGGLKVLLEAEFRDPELADALGACSESGTALYFDASRIKWLTTAGLRSVVAHEMSHALEVAMTRGAMVKLGACGVPEAITDRAARIAAGRSTASSEAIAETLQAACGFPLEAVTGKRPPGYIVKGGPIWARRKQVEGGHKARFHIEARK